MSGGHEVGISPALLQAITHTISKPNNHSQDGATIQNGNNSMQNKPPNIGINRRQRQPPIIKVVSHGHSLEQIQEAISAMGQQVFQAGNTIFVVQNINDTIKSEELSANIKIEQKDNSLNESDIDQALPGFDQSHSHVGSLLHSSNGQRSEKCSIDLGYDKETGISAVHNVVTETVVQTSYRHEPLENVENTEKYDLSHRHKIRIFGTSDINVENNENNSTYILNTGQNEGDEVTINTDQGSVVYRTVSAAVSSITPQSDSPSNDGINPPFIGIICPICGDRVSGYHYGIYSCESCKGFFKRTVQNKKAFICHRMGECMVSIANRKKCPACRFKRCLVAGMKLEAIREDRTRGGRSSYDGCTPNRPVKIRKDVKKKTSMVSTGIRQNVLINPTIVQTSSGTITIPTLAAGNTSYSLSPQSNHSSPGMPTPRKVDFTQIQPQTPALLEDLMAVESLMTEDDEEQACCEGKMINGDSNIFSSLLHFADHCLYKIVRWARNLPDFASVSTDDQIILLQNCWAELLCLSCCWKSIRSPPGTLKLCHGRTLTLDQAQVIGLEDLVQRMLGFTEILRQMETDNYEFVAMKALLLLSPDVKNMKDEFVVRKYQDQLIESLMIYTTTNSPSKADKFCQLLARLPELTRLCVLGKEQLAQRQLVGEVPQYSLLSELLKGDITIT